LYSGAIPSGRNGGIHIYSIFDGRDILRTRLPKSTERLEVVAVPENDSRKSRYLAVWIFVGVLLLYVASMGPFWRFRNLASAPTWFPQVYATVYTPLAWFSQWTGTADAFERYADWWWVPSKSSPAPLAPGAIPPPSPYP
jgi:hypothetical protein